MAEETFEFTDGSSNKFWTINLEGSSFTVTFGKIGTAGQTQTKTFSSDAEATAAYSKLVAEKLKKGYIRVSGAVATQSQAKISTASNVVQLRPASAKNASAEMEQNAPPSPQVSASSKVAVAEKSDVNEFSEEALSPALSQPTKAPREPKISLKPDDYAWCAWIPRVRKGDAPKPVPFNRDDALRRFADMSADGYKWITNVRKKMPIPLSWGREEAEFWFRATEAYASSPAWILVPSEREKHVLAQQTKERIFEALRFGRFGGTVTSAETDLLYQQITSTAWAQPIHENHLFLLCALYAPRDLIQFIAGQFSARAYEIMLRFRELVMPYLSEEDLEDLRSVVRKELVPGNWLKPHPKSHIRSFYVIAAFLRMGDEIQDLVEQLPDGAFHNLGRYEIPHALIFALPTREAMLKHARRLGLSLGDYPYMFVPHNSIHDHLIRCWMGCTEDQGLDMILPALGDTYHKDDKEKRLKTLMLAEVPELVPVMIDLLNSSDLAPLARTWLETHPWWSVSALLELCGQKGKLADTAKEILSNLRNALSVDDVDQATLTRIHTMFSAPDDSLSEMHESQLPSWLADVLANSRITKEKLPEWVTLGAVPRITLNRQKLPLSVMEQILFALKKSTLEHVHPIILALRSGLEPRSCDRTVWWLFDRWLKSGASPKDKWAMFSTGLLGSDDTALKLTPLIRQWPGESQHQRAVLGLECLRQIGSDTALMQINGIAQKVPFKALKQKAAECMEYIAKERGFSREQLEDRIVPDCGLDERGQRIFDFGTRKFSFVLSGEMKAMVKDEDGKVKPDLPKPNTKDDAELSAAAMQDWKLFKQQVKEVAKVQAFRLEQAMVTGRRWSAADFQSLLVQHPLMVNIVRLIVWGVFDVEGVLTRSFRVTEDQSLADENDKSFSLAGDEIIGVVHPLHMPPDERSKWTEIFADYELITPFPQLSRPIYGLDESEKAKDEITRFEGKMLPAASICSVLEKNGWQRGEIGDGGCFSEHYKYFPGADITAVAEYDWIGIGMIVESDDQDIKSVYFLPGKSTGFYRYDKRPATPLEFVDSIVISEVLTDLMLLASKQRE